MTTRLPLRDGTGLVRRGCGRYMPETIVETHLMAAILPILIFVIAIAAINLIEFKRLD